MPDRTNLQLITERLPFAIDDADAVNALYASCDKARKRREKQYIELWTYGYIYRYMAAKYAGGSIRQTSDMDELVSAVYEKVQNGRDSIRNPDKYAHWVSVVAKNTFINYVNRHRVDTTSIHEPQQPTLKQADAVKEIDANVGLMRTQLQAAIRRLPPYLRRVAELYYFKECTFKEIAECIDKDVPVVRTYKSRALKALREDTRLQAVLDGL
ncbi:RNA polymerase subunit sigma-70 [Longimonas halophila]|uniref:RNA polymerase subunit sigma-70 n=1 Tax=Longimonas halophila TaxID=1469170 RepID=A0A2H3P3G3_9BACT|nr:sigma-70 family RNA polymerase sigma factor [Longimonas halophila]PEN08822.1 RNA polymerase subunit sigma-70 [Longimonas halophila]